jgi:hypothetical protein
MKSSIIIYSLLLGLLFGPLWGKVQAQTIFNNKHFTQDTILTVNGSPYEVTSDLVVSGGATLTLEAGVKLIFDPDVQFFLEGKIKANGIQGDSVYLVVTPDTTTRPFPFNQRWEWHEWKGITGLANGSKAPVIEAEYFVATDAEFLFNELDSVTVRHSSFLYNDTVAVISSNLEADHCLFSYYLKGIRGTFQISHSIFTGGWEGLISDKGIIEHSQLLNHEGIALLDQNGTIIRHCSIINNQEGIRLTTSSSWAPGFRDTSLILHNELIDNSVGIRAVDQPNAVNIEGRVRDNVICGYFEIDLMVADSFNIDFSQNCWCSTDTTEILNKMFPITGGSSLSDPTFLLPFQTDCVPDQVYPGDANHDQVADVLDILAIGQYFGQTGPSRPNATLSWQGQDATDWDSLQTTGYDLKHIDSDGNGTIGWSDTLAVRLNYGRTHRSRRTASVSGIPLILQAPATVQNPGDTVRLPIALGTVDTIANNIYGIAFSIHYDSTQLAPHPSVAFFNSWLGNPGTDLITFWHLDSVDHRVDVAFVRTNGQARTGFGQIAELVVVIDDDITKREVPLRLSFSNVHAIDTAGNMIAVSDFVERTVVEVEYFGNLFRAYPNPASNFIFVEPKTSAPYNVIFVDMTGKEWITRQNLIGKQRISLANQPRGLYVLRAQTGGISESFKVVHP